MKSLLFGEFKIKNQPFYQIFFEKESPLKYEDLLSLWFEIDPDYKKLIERQQGNYLETLYGYKWTNSKLY